MIHFYLMLDTQVDKKNANYQIPTRGGFFLSDIAMIFFLYTTRPYIQLIIIDLRFLSKDKISNACFRDKKKIHASNESQSCN